MPPINDIDILLQVFTHPSISRNSRDRMDTGEEAYCDNERLSFLGELTLDSAVTDVLFRHRPTLRAEQIVVSSVEVCLIWCY